MLSMAPGCKCTVRASMEVVGHLMGGYPLSRERDQVDILNKYITTLTGPRDTAYCYGHTL